MTEKTGSAEQSLPDPPLPHPRLPDDDEPPAVGMDERADLECASDVRDKEIERHGGRYASALVSAGLLGVLVLTMLDTHSFFVAQAAFGAGALASMADAAVRIRAYRRGFTP